MKSKIVILSMLLMAVTLDGVQASAAVDRNADNVQGIGIKSTNTQAISAQAIGTQATGAQTIGTQVTGTQSTNTQAIGAQTTGVQAIGTPQAASNTGAVVQPANTSKATNATEAKARSGKYRNKFFVGGAIQLTNFKAKFNKSHALHNSTTWHNGNRFNFDKEIQGSVNAGFNYYFPVGANNALFISPEIVYNFSSQDSSKTMALTNGASTNFNLKLEPTWEAKLSLGMEFKHKFFASVGGGVQWVDYDYNYKSQTANSHRSHRSNGQDDLAVGGSLALGYNLGKSLILKTSVSYYSFDFKLRNQDVVIPGTSIVQDKIKAEMLTAKLGVEWAF